MKQLQPMMNIAHMRLSLTACVFLFLFTGMHAQNGMSAGCSAQLINNRIVDLSAKTLRVKGAYRPATSLFVEFELGRRFALQTGLGYTMMTQNSEQFKNNFHYLAVPIYFTRGRSDEDKRIAYSTLFGFNLHYLLGASHVYLDETKEDIVDLSQPFHADLVIGPGININITDKIRLDVYAALSFGTYINKITPAQLYLNNLNTGFGVNLCYKLR